MSRCHIKVFFPKNYSVDVIGLWIRSKSQHIRKKTNNCGAQETMYSIYRYNL